MMDGQMRMKKKDLTDKTKVKSTTHKLKTCGLVMNNQVLDVEAVD